MWPSIKLFRRLHLFQLHAYYLSMGLALQRSSYLDHPWNPLGFLFHLGLGSIIPEVKSYTWTACARTYVIVFKKALNELRPGDKQMQKMSIAEGTYFFLGGPLVTKRLLVSIWYAAQRKGLHTHRGVKEGHPNILKFCLSP